MLFAQRLLHVALILFAAMSSALANQDHRTWILDNGQSIYAELMTYEEKSGRVILRTPEMRTTEFQERDFSSSDRAWLLEWTEIGEELTTTLKRLGGTFEHLEVNQKYLTELYVYYPSGTTRDARLPMMIVFDPGGKAMRYALRHMEAADATKMIIVACGSFRDAVNDSEENGFTQRFAEVLPLIKRSVPHDSARIFLGGTAGGAARAYAFSAEFPEKWAGIYANGGRLPDKAGPQERMYPAVRVAVVNGERDGANQRIAADAKILHARGCDVGIFAFEGGLQLPTLSAQKQAFRWLLKIDQ